MAAPKFPRFHKNDEYSSLKVLKNEAGKWYIGKILRFFNGKIQHVALSGSFATSTLAQAELDKKT